MYINQLYSTFLFIFVTHIAAADKPIVHTKFGPVLGRWMETSWNLPVTAYLGIPYAEPPIGEFRFKSPRPWQRSWDKVRDATEDGSPCVQLNRDKKLFGSEDCLFLNIFVPEINDDEKLPILVYIHGGGFLSGSNNSTLYGPTYLLNQRIILVTLNYRLGILGFLSTGNQASPGNYGLKDVVQALKWIQENIEVFGGDPSLVTLSGQSAGASLAHHLALSKRTEGLFDKLITQSGSANAPWGIHSSYTAKIRYIAIAIQLGCSTSRKIMDVNESPLDEDEDYESMVEDDMQILDCLREKSPRNITEQIFFFQMWDQQPYCNFGPTIEPDGEDAIVTEHPMTIIEKEEFRDIPWIAGVTSDEGLLKTMDLFVHDEKLNDLGMNFEKIAPLFLETEEIIENTILFSDQLIDFYLPSIDDKMDEPLRAVKDNITAMASDGLINYWIYEALNVQTPKMNSSTFFYEFAYMGTYSTTFGQSVSKHVGVSHSDDLNFLFPFCSVLYADLQLHNTATDDTMINIMTEMWANFVKTGIPSARLTPDWEPYREDFRFMKLGMGRSPDISMEKDFLLIRMEFWQNLIGNVSVPRGDLFPARDDADSNNDKDDAANMAKAKDADGDKNTAHSTSFKFNVLSPLLITVMLIIN